MATLFFSYSHKDEALRDELETHLSALRREGLIETWHDRRIGAGEEWAAAIDRHVETDDVILLLISPDFIGSDYCNDLEMTRAMERHDAGEAVVIPVILRPSDWEHSRFARLQAVPTDGIPVTLHANRDVALLQVARAVRDAIGRREPPVGSDRASSPPGDPVAPDTAAFDRRQERPRSSDLALARTFTERDRDVFRQETFDYMAAYFENSGAELAARNPGIEVDVRRDERDRFSAVVYRGGTAVTRCTVFVGDRMFAGGIAYSSEATSSRNSYNELLAVRSDDVSLFLTSMGMQATRGRGGERLTQEGASELYWGMLIGPLKPR